MSQASRFWDRMADGYAKKPVPDEAVYQKKLAVTREALTPDMDVFEFGCGTGSTAIALAPNVKHIRATDISARMIEIARDKAEAAGVTNVTFEQAGIDDLDVPDGTYDAVLAHSILHLVEDRDAMIARVHRMLKPGGVFVSSTVCIGNMMVLFRFILPLAHALRLLPVIRVFTTKQLVASVNAAGFAIEHQWLPGKGKSVFAVARKAK